jgi:hypothetical protein
MNLYAWKKPAFVNGSPVDHTWVTSYDTNNITYNNIDDVIKSHENYWHCHGDFHSTGQFIGRMPYSSRYATCLVRPNDKNENGTIFRYGIDGVCHQVSNQILYTNKNALQNLVVNRARGYKVSSLVYGAYGRKKDAWNVQKNNCLVGRQTNPISLLTSRLHDYIRKNNIDISFDIDALEARRLLLLQTIEEEGIATRLLDETSYDRAMKLNGYINDFLRYMSELLEQDMFKNVTGIEPFMKINIINPEFFRFDFIS